MSDIVNIQTLLTAIIVAIPTSYFSVHFALKKYRTQKWWDKKADCYFEIINALNDLIRYCDIQLDEKLDDISVSNENKELLKKEFHKGKLILQTQVNIGSLLLPEDVIKDLLSLDSALISAERESEITQQIAATRCAAEDCLFNLIPNAKNDLGIKKALTIASTLTVFTRRFRSV